MTASGLLVIVWLYCSLRVAWSLYSGKINPFGGWRGWSRETEPRTYWLSIALLVVTCLAITAAVLIG